MNVQTIVRNQCRSLHVLTWMGFVVVLLIFGGYAAILTRKEFSNQELLRNELRELRQENQLLFEQNQQLEASCLTTAAEPEDERITPPPNAEISKTIEGALERSFVYTVRKGDTIWDIAAVYQIDAQDLMRWNHLTSRSQIFPGDQLTIIFDE
ncbi:hypothetical protein CSA56_01320 [candidate division KSB3 bacterium]|uniref:LysM domain-containing protein n=1 Tax=candidate division KSB3 bacterium TaxID=2044937 RepID=A0A2G6KKF1_9BACT|nr:MAG: hypothetical protein CSA56_01320 [candidate division KSB3 bacterium]